MLLFNFPPRPVILRVTSGLDHRGTLSKNRARHSVLRTVWAQRPKARETQRLR